MFGTLVTTCWYFWRIRKDCALSLRVHSKCIGSQRWEMLLWVLQLHERCVMRSSCGASTLDVLYRIMPLPFHLLLIGCQMLEHNGCMFGTAVIRKCTVHMFASSCIIPELFSILQYAAGIYLCIWGISVLPLYNSGYF